MEIILVLVILIYSAILHEIAHGYVADRLGDPTARLLGRLTLDPRPHIDPMWSIALPLLMLLSGGIVVGAAKPVPVDPFNLREGRKDVALVSLAGPLTNIVLAILGALLLRFTLPLLQGFPPGTGLILLKIMVNIVHINLILAVFNLLPIPPLDGSKVFALLLPERDAATYLAFGNIGLFLILFLLYISPLGNLIFNLVTFGQNLLLP